jgi:polyisoprenyl-teichoic acid--peptidoglycan teichoic acid transferase
VPDSKSSKGFRTYRGGHAGNDPEAARFDFSGAGAGAGASTATPPRPTPEGMPPPDMRPPGSPPDRPIVAAPGRPPGPPKRRRIGWKRGILLGITAVVLILGVWIFLGYRAFSNEVAKANARLGPKTRAALTPVGSVLFNSQNTLILGSDSRGKGSTSGARADSIIIMRTNPHTHLISMLSIPRDLDVPIPGHGNNKINAAFAYGGAPLLIKTINKLTGLKVNHIVLVDFTGFRDLIDTLGGVTVDNPTKVISSQPFGGYYWHFAKGEIHLDGRHALAYSRIRHTTNPADSDITRTQRQQRVMTALSHQLVQPSNIFNLPTIGKAIAEPLTTDLTARDFLGLGWVKFRSSRTLQCHLGGTPQVIGGQDVILSSPQNASVLGMFLGTQAPQHAPAGQLYGPGCSIHG